MEFVYLDKKTLMQKIDLFCELYQSCFSDRIDSEIVKKRYIDNPYGDLIMYTAIDKGKFVSSYAALPYYMDIGSERVKAALGINLMTHPDYNGRGLAQEVFKGYLDVLQERGYSMAKSFPNYLSNGMLIGKMGYKEIYEYPTLTLNIEKDTKPRGISGDVKKGFDFEPVQNESVIQIVKDKQYINWRYVNHPTSKYYAVSVSPENWAVYKFYGEDEMNVVELHSRDNEALKLLCDFLINTATENGCKKVTTWCKTNTSQHCYLERIGFRIQAPIRYFAIKKLCYNGNIDLFDARNWNTQMGDDNVY